MKVKIKKLYNDVATPEYATDGSACFDIKCYSPNQLEQTFSTTIELNTGLSVEVPEGHVLLLYSRSGQGFKKNIRLANCTGILDSDYRGEIKVKLTCDNRSLYPIVVNHGDAIAQGMIIPIPKIEFEVVKDLSDTERGSKGFGSTDKVKA